MKERVSIADIIERWRTGGQILEYGIAVLDRTTAYAGRDIRILADALEVARNALNAVNSEVDMLCEEGPKLIGPEIALARIESIARRKECLATA